jgi:NADH:ubiquinone oxidoreductase subunit K
MMFNYKNFLVTMMSVEIMYLGAATSFVLCGVVLLNNKSAVYGLLVLIFAACESAVGLGLLVAIFRFGRNIDFVGLLLLGG